MSKHLRTRVIEQLRATCATFVELPESATPRARSVRYLTFCEGINSVHQAIDPAKEGQKYRKRIVVRPSRHHLGLHELYTYHFPKQWSAACVANRELIKEAQRQAHAIERDHSEAALEWRIQFLHQLYTLPAWYKGMDKVPAEKRRYPHFYSFVFATIYRALKSAAQGETAKKEQAAQGETAQKEQAAQGETAQKEQAAQGETAKKEQVKKEEQAARGKEQKAVWEMRAEEVTFEPINRIDRTKPIVRIPFGYKKFPLFLQISKKSSTFALINVINDVFTLSDTTPSDGSSGRRGSD